MTSVAAEQFHREHDRDDEELCKRCHEHDCICADELYDRQRDHELLQADQTKETA